MNEVPQGFFRDFNSLSFEIPYNFDSHLIEILAYLLKDFPQICHCIYAPAFADDYPEIVRTMDTGVVDHTMTREKYEKHIHYINKFFPGKVQILLQRRTHMLHEKELLYYINKLGVRKFCCGTYEQAKIIKDIDPTIEVTGSITMRITHKDLDEHPEYKGVFNRFVLPFHYGRDLEGIKKLPFDYEYLILANSNCNASCIGYNHWLAEDQTQVQCPGIGTDDFNTPWKDFCMIRPMDLGIFQPYISTFKLQDRGWVTFEIVSALLVYMYKYTNLAGIEYSEDLYNREQFDFS